MRNPQNFFSWHRPSILNLWLKWRVRMPSFFPISKLAKWYRLEFEITSRRFFHDGYTAMSSRIPGNIEINSPTIRSDDSSRHRRRQGTFHRNLGSSRTKNDLKNEIILNVLSETMMSFRIDSRIVVLIGKYCFYMRKCFLSLCLQTTSLTIRKSVFELTSRYFLGELNF